MSFDRKPAFSEDELIEADLIRMRNKEQALKDDPYGRQQAAAVHARDFEMTRIQARNNGEGWAQ
jgi:hypothetical protein